MNREHVRAALAVLLIGVGTGAGARAASTEPFQAALTSELAHARIPSCAVQVEGRHDSPRARMRGCVRPAGDHGAREALQSIYRTRGARPLWSGRDGPTPEALELLRRLEEAGRYGLEPDDYDARAIGELAAALESPGRERSILAAHFDVALTVSALQFLADLHYGRVDPRQAGFQIDARREPFDLAEAIERLAAASDVSRIIESVEPRFYHYQLLEQALQRYRALARQAGLTDLPRPRHPLRLGERYAGAPALRRLLAALGDLPASRAGAASSSDSVDGAIVAAVRSFQSRHGLKVDGILGRATYAALVTPMAYRVRQIDLTLERWRWLPVFRTPPIIVNIPQFRLFAFRSTADRKASILQMDVIVGKAYPLTRTPVFAADMRYVIFRPYWDIPYDIMRREMLAHIRSDPRYLAEQHLQIVRGGSDAALPLPATRENVRALAAGQLRLRQAPGPENALGLIKFIFPNAHDVYLHSTPAHQLFSEARRAFSHGCIRVSDPVALAAQVLRGTPGDWTPAKIEAAMNGARTFRVTLATPVRVMILYGTVLATESGEVMFFDDLYGDDRRLAALLHLRPVD
jgi:L,D-transpeptidase YcbB